MFKFKVVVGQLVVQGLLVCKSFLQVNLLLLEVSLLQVELLSSDRPILLVPLNRVMEKSLLLGQELSEGCGLYSKSV